MKDKDIINEAMRIVEEANRQKVLLRILGAVAVAIHTKDLEYIHERLRRRGDSDKEQRFTDIDFMACRKQYRKVRRLFEDDLKYTVDSFMLLHRKNRLIYYHPEQLHMDVFFDKLEYSHDVIFCNKKNRLSLDSPTISLADMILEKTQIHQINEKDIKDIVVLLLGHRIGNEDYKEIINAKHIAQILADDWEFWYDARTNLNKVKKASKQYVLSGLLTLKEDEDVAKKVDEILSYTDKEEKSRKWKKREKIGIKKQWWHTVEEISR